MKKVIYIIASILFLTGSHLTIRYAINEIYIKSINNGNYDNKIGSVLKIFNYPETYITYYNIGNSYYRKDDFARAEKEYEKALKSVPDKKSCPIRVNLSLSKLAQLDYENDNDIKSKIEDIQEILLGTDCATKDNKGRDKNSQELYNELEKYKNSKEEPGKEDPDKDKDNDQNKDNNNNNNKEEKDLEQKLKQQQIQSSNEREKIYGREEYEYYRGKTW